MPVAVNDAYAVTPNTALTVPAPGVLGNDTDPDPGITLTAAITAGPAHGALTLNANGGFTYTPNVGFTIIHISFLAACVSAS